MSGQPLGKRQPVAEVLRQETRLELNVTRYYATCRLACGHVVTVKPRTRAAIPAHGHCMECRAREVGWPQIRVVAR